MMCCGVRKSGSPRINEITGSPRAQSCRTSARMVLIAVGFSSDERTVRATRVIAASLGSVSSQTGRILTRVAQPCLQDLRRRELFELQHVTRGVDQGGRRHEPDDSPSGHGNPVALRFALDRPDPPADRRLPVIRRFIDTWTMPRSSSATPIALTKRKPPLLKRTAAAIFLATSSRSVARLML